MSWESTMPIATQNFLKCGFGTLSEVRDEQDEEYSEGHMDCPIISSGFSVSTNQSQLMIRRQVWMAQAASAW
jgi:hypothetical protein